MSGSLPTVPGFKTAELIHNQPTIVSRSESGRYQTRIAGGHLWEIKVVYPPMFRSVFAPVYAFCISQRGRFGSFEIKLPQFNTPQGVGTGVPLVQGNHAAGLSVIESDGWTNLIVGILKAGDILKFASHSKVYMLTADADSGAGTGDAQLKIEPPLVRAILDNDSITVNDVPFTVIMNNKLQSFKTVNPSIMEYSLDLIEAIK